MRQVETSFSVKISRFSKNVGGLETVASALRDALSSIGRDRSDRLMV